MDLFNFIGSIGTGLYLFAYALLSLKKTRADSVTYMGMNLIASCCMLISLTVNWNAPSFFGQICWAAISLYGLMNCVMARRALAKEIGQINPSGSPTVAN
ncbi:CBU_0592 family membrane protein [Ferrimonas lipolytica]|uniref:CBU-0592-like domain-containing protein n=1 Tax=Ferrimonas lipolytica TaxID=2724191 RepID=A0A6H1UDG0_9GAMM|nr:hypothetical protein [Ferrimonas lipolytica]QIZ76630.1 hypothetical protein HER31_06960 [Ferrimonas lipolytica]